MASSDVPIVVESESDLLEGPDGDVTGEIDIDPNDTSLIDTADVDDAVGVESEPMVVDSADKTFVAPEDADSAVGSDLRTGTDSSFQSSSSGAPREGDDTTSDADGETSSGDASLVTSTAPMDVHECVSLISDAVHVQSASTVGVVDTRLVSFIFHCWISVRLKK